MQPNSGERGAFGFPFAVEREFGFLTAHGFRCVSTKSTLVRYESDHVFINIYHGRSSYEIGIEVGSTDLEEQEKGFSLFAFIHLAAPDKAATYRNFVAVKPEAVSVRVAALQKLFTQYVLDVLMGDPDIFIKLEAQRKKISAAYASEVRASQIRPRAEAAFRDKDYPEAVRLYEIIQDELTTTEIKKLKYARQHS